jgi:hypothetical protein
VAEVIPDTATSTSGMALGAEALDFAMSGKGSRNFPRPPLPQQGSLPLLKEEEARIEYNRNLGARGDADEVESTTPPTAQQISDNPQLSQVYQQEAREALAARGIQPETPKTDDPYFGRSFVDNLFGLTGERYQTWPEKMLKSALDAAQAPGQILKGERRPDVETAFNLAGLVIGGPFPLVRKTVDGTLGSMAGVASRTADMSMLNLARKYDGKKSVDEIYEATGWYRDYENNWRYEIPSNKASLNHFQALLSSAAEDLVGNVKLPVLLDFPEIYKAYPHLKDMTVKVMYDSKNPSWGRFMGDKIEINMAHLRDYNTILDTIIHEVQHSIQAKEGLKHRGSNPEHVKKQVADSLKAVGKERLKANPNDDLADLIQLAKDIGKDGESFANYLYRRDPGEIEARVAKIVL